MNKIVKLIATPFMQRLSPVFPSCFGRWTNISLVLMLTITLGFCPIYAQNTSSNNKATDLYSNVQISNEMKYKMPSEYLNKLNDFLKKEYPNMGKGDNNTWKYTLDFALKEMESDLSISKEYRWLFVWNVIYYNHTGDYLIDIDDYDSDIMKEFGKFYNEFEACSDRYEKGYLSLLEIIGAENQKRIVEAQKQSAEARQQNIDKGLGALTEIIDYFDEYISCFKDKIKFDGVSQTLINFNQEKNSLSNRIEKLRSEQQINQNPSATEAEDLKKKEEQLLTDLTNQRIAVVKQIYSVIDKNISEIEKLINSSAQKYEDAQQQINEAKQRFADAKMAISDSKFTSAEAKLISTMVLLQSAEYQRQSAEARKQSAEYQRQSAEYQRQSAENIIKITKGLNETLALYKELYPFFKEHSDHENLKKFKSNAQELIRLCKKYGVDYKAVLSTEIIKFYGIEE